MMKKIPFSKTYVDLSSEATIRLHHLVCPERRHGRHVPNCSEIQQVVANLAVFALDEGVRIGTLSEKSSNEKVLNVRLQGVVKQLMELETSENPNMDLNILETLATIFGDLGRDDTKHHLVGLIDGIDEGRN